MGTVRFDVLFRPKGDSIMAIRILPKRARFLGGMTVLAALSGCGAASPALPSLRAPLGSMSETSTAPPTAQERAAAQAQRESPTRPAAAPERGTDFDVETVELIIEGQAEEPILPCTLRITHDEQGSMILDFHAQRSTAPRILQQTQELGFYFNQNREDEHAVRMPNGRPDPASFPLREILRTRPIATVEYLPDGARLTLSPDKPGRSERMRAEVLWHAGDLLPGLPFEGKTCPELPPGLQASVELPESQ